MNCQEAIELLPWLLNGSLEKDEERVLRDHLASCESCRSELAETGDSWQIFTRHVPSLALAEYAQGLVPTELDNQLIESHLGWCDSCRREAEWGMSDRILPFRAPSKEVLHRTERRRSWRGLAAASLAAVLATSALVWSFTGSSKPVLMNAELAAQAPARRGAERRRSADGWQVGRGAKTSLFGNGIFSDGFESGETTAWSGSTE